MAAALGGCVGLVWEQAMATADGMASLVGLVIGLALYAAWFVYALILVGVLFLSGRSVEQFVGSRWLARPRRWWDN